MASLSLRFVALSFVAALTALPAARATDDVAREMRFVQVAAKSVMDRSAIADAGMSIEFTRSDSVWGFANGNAIRRLEQAGFRVLGNFDYDVGRGGHETIFDFPASDSRFHNYAETVAMLKSLQSSYADVTRLQSIGKTIENRDIWALHLNTTPDALRNGASAKPGIVFMGNHHAREHVSNEIPLMLADYLLKNREEAEIAHLLDSRDIWIIPMVNPDGVEWDISTGRYKMWRKNRRNNGDGTFGVDLNRNYGFKWGTGGSDTDTSSDVYMGTQPFSEPETQTIKTFVEGLPNTKVLLTFHTFSELILYPWGHKYDPIENTRDHSVFDKLARTMAQWNHYKPQQSSQLYIASGDTTDWAYGERGIFAFTFELSPKDMWSGGFYPGQSVLDRVFQDNLRPCLYLMDIAEDPYKVLGNQPSGWLRNYVEPQIPHELFWNPTKPY